MFTDEKEWLPVGSIVRLEGGERLIMVSGFMIQDAVSQRYWDYVGYPYPEGRRDGQTDYFFDKSMIEEIHQIGYLNADGCLFETFLEEHTKGYGDAKKESVDASTATPVKA